MTTSLVRTTGISLVAAIAPTSVAAQQPPPGELVAEWTIGGIEVSEGVPTSIGHVAPLPDGSVWLSDPTSHRLMAYGEDGDFRYAVGREGEGPGEFEDLGGLEPFPGGRVAALDRRNGRVTAFAGAEPGLMISVRGGYFTGGMFAVTDEGRALLLSLDPDRRGARDDPAREWVVYDSTGAVVDALDVPLRDSRGPALRISTPNGSRWPFTIRTLSAVDRGGRLVVGRNDAYRIVRRASDGTETVWVERPYDRLPVARGEMRAWRAVVREFEERAGAELGSPPDRKPVYRGFGVAPDGRLWVSMYSEATYVEEAEGVEAWLEPNRYEVFEASGEPWASVTLPPGHRLAAARDDRVWTFHTGDLGEQYLTQHRIR